MSTPPPAPGQPQVPDPGATHCPRCSAPIGPEQDWCLECGAPARTRLAQTPNWRLPTVAIGAVVLVAGALLAFAFVTLTNDNDVPAGTTPTADDTAPVAPPVGPAVTAPLPAATSTAPVAPAVPGQTATVPAPITTTTLPAPTTTGGQQTVPPFSQTTTTP